jgi:cytochrome b6-f complex iron-sulfur subunit
MTETIVSRRSFLKLGWGAAGALVLVEVGSVVLSFFSPRVVEGEFGGMIDAGTADSFPVGSVTPFTQGRFYLVRMSDGGFLALYRKCTHLGCTVPWNPAEGRFVCPCHASAFEANGQVINPPAPRPLDRFAVTIVDGIVRVDTGMPIPRDRTSDADLAYAEVMS